ANFLDGATPNCVPTTTTGTPRSTILRTGVRKGSVSSGVRITPAGERFTTLLNNAICPSTSSSRGGAFQYTSIPFLWARCAAPACSGSHRTVPQERGMTAINPLRGRQEAEKTHTRTATTPIARRAKDGGHEGMIHSMGE